MANAIWLFLALPVWFCSALKDPFGAGLLSEIPLIGILSLVAGVIGGLVQRRFPLLLFLLPIVQSECYVAIAGMLRGQVRGGASIAPLCIFLGLQACMIGLLIYRSKGARLTATLLALFCLSYALFASVVAGMAFANDWL
jgi:hypothetical protein